MTLEQNQRIVADVTRERSRLRQFIRRHVIDERDAEEILQDVFFELIEAYRLTKPIEQVGAWLFRVARNRITDRFRTRRKEVALPDADAGEEAGLTLEGLLPDADAGPEAAFARRILLEEMFTSGNLCRDLHSPARALLLSRSRASRSGRSASLA